MIKVRIPTQLRSLTDDAAEVPAEGATLGDVIADLDGRYPGISQRLLSDGQLRRFVNLYVDGEDARFLQGLATSVPAGAEVSIIPAVAGGS
ncbi:MAG: MoaD/ThiS family protein [Actinomycetota bacterium]|nr:MoaD/ThiS family protein [Actinomycetota bacterium]